LSISAQLYDNALANLFNGTAGTDLLTHTLKIILATSSYTPDQATHTFKSDITSEVASTGGYTAGGITLTDKTLGLGSHTIAFHASSVVWPASTIRARYAIVYDNNPATDATRPLLLFVDFGEDQISTGTDFPIQWNADGLFTIIIGRGSNDFLLTGVPSSGVAGMPIRVTYLAGVAATTAVGTPINVGYLYGVAATTAVSTAISSAVSVGNSSVKIGGVATTGESGIVTY
jgi:hypothetical protein